MEKVLKAIGVGVAFAGGIILILPLSVLFGWIAGMIVKLFCGSLITNGLNLLFNTNRFTPDSIPTITATLSILASYMRTRVEHKE